MGLPCALAIALAPHAKGDELGYLVNVTMRPGYHFASSADALRYGHDLCGKVSQGYRYSDIVAEVKVELTTPDDYQATYLIGQAVDQLCPALIWQLRSSAAASSSVPVKADR
ncbi:MAG: DUF732 domain-containing protein [Mycolicibacter algericus]|uniref:DUF732 domain-containing protein n=1 Tax=Mycolicibacter algericus TaxID=1288388 RepID=UPI003C75C5B7